MERVWTFFLHKSQFTLLLTVAIIAFGLTAIISMPKESTPDVEMPIGVVVTVLPGANAEDVEKLVTNELEVPLKNNLEHVKNITSTSKSGVSTITVEFTADADIDDSIKKLKDEVDSAKVDLPDDATEPRIIQLDFTKEPVVTFAVAADVPQGMLLDLSKKIEDTFETLPGVASVDIHGVQAREVHVLVRKEALARYNLLITDVARAIAAQNVALPSGSVNLSGEEYAVRFEGDVDEPSAVAQLPIAAPGGVPLTVGDVATVIDGYEESRTLSRLSASGEPARPSFSVDIYKKPGAQITAVGEAVREELMVLQQPGEILDGVTVSVTFDRADMLADDLRTLGLSGLTTVLLVVGVLFIAIGWREALVAGFSIPLSFLMAFVGMNYAGNTINFVSLFALILSTGIIVDSAIVMVEGINTHYRHDAGDKLAAAVAAIRDYQSPLIAGTLTTVAVFVPLFNISGVTGEFIAAIPFTIIFVLMSSLFVALAITPLFASMMLAQRSHSTLADKRRELVARIRSKYERWLLHFLSDVRNTRALMWVMTIFFIVALTFPTLGAVRTIFFPAENSEYVFVEAELGSGAVLANTDQEMRKIEEIVYDSNIRGIQSFSTIIGQSSAFSNAFEGVRTDQKLGNILITLDTSSGVRSDDVVAALQEHLAGITTSDILVGQIDGGPPTGEPIVLTFYGDDLGALDTAARSAVALLETTPGTRNVTATTKDNSLEFALTLDRYKAISHGVTALTVAQALNTALAGNEATTIKLFGEDIPVRVQMDFSGRGIPESSDAVPVDALRYMPITLVQDPTGVANPEQALLGSFVNTALTESRTVVRHDNAERITKVSSKLADGANAREVTALFRARADKELTLPDGVRMEIGGENEDVDQSFTDMFVALAFGLTTMFAILVIQFNSFRHTRYVLLTVPLSLIGVFAGLLIMNKPLSFPSIMGFIALAGIVVNNAIILIDVMNREYHEHPDEPLEQVVVRAASSRLRPVILTAVTTVVGIMPLVFAAELWAPLAYSIIFGLSFATVITLVLIPSIYYRHLTRKVQ